MKTQIATLVLGLAMLASVAPAQDAQRLPRSLTSDTSANAVTVQNNRKVPVTVYMENGQFDLRLGMVPASKTATLPLPPWTVQGRTRIQLFVHPEGDVYDLATQEFALQPPARLAMVVPPWGNMPATPTDTMMAAIPPEELADATLTVDNPRAKPVTVFVDQGDFDMRLGQVPAHSRTTLRFPKAAILPDQSIQIFVHPEDGFDLSTQTLQIQRGEHLGLRVPVQ